jgi:tricorn protease
MYVPLAQQPTGSGSFGSATLKRARDERVPVSDIDVENWPKDVIAGKDPQLERAVDEAMRLLKAKPIDRLTAEPPPTWGKRKGSGSN